jgi:hypothetical protein
MHFPHDELINFAIYSSARNRPLQRADVAP